MFVAYFKSIIVYMIILSAEMFIFKKNLLKNGWGSEQPSPFQRDLMYLVGVAAVPFFRFLMMFMFFVAAAISKEDFDKIIKEAKQEVEDEYNERSSN